MKHRKHPEFPSYRFYKDGTVISKLTKKPMVRKKKNHFKLINKEGKRITINLPRILYQLFPELKPKEEKLPIKPKKQGTKRRTYTPAFKRKIRKELSQGLTWDELVKKYDIPMGSIGYLVKGKPMTPTVYINIGKVIIR